MRRCHRRHQFDKSTVTLLVTPYTRVTLNGSAPRITRACSRAREPVFAVIRVLRRAPADA